MAPLKLEKRSVLDYPFRVKIFYNNVIPCVSWMFSYFVKYFPVY